MRCLFCLGVSRLPKKYIHITIYFPLAKTYPLCLGRSFFDQKLGIKASPVDSFLEIPQISQMCLLQSRPSKSAPRHWRFFLNRALANRPTKKNKVLFVQWVKRRDNSPRFKIQDDGAVLVTKKEFCLSHLPFCARPWPWQKNSIFGCKSAGGELGGNDLSDQSSRRIIHCKGCADVHLQQEYTKNWGYLHHLTSIESIDNNSSILEYYSAHTLRFPADSADS